MLATGPVPQMISGNDIFVVIEGAWRVIQGQRPHVDFNSSLGAGVFLQLALAFKLFGLTVNAIPRMQALTGVAVGLWCWAVAAPRLRATPWLTASLSALVGYFTLASFTLDDVVMGVSYVGTYNHLAHSLLVVLGADVLLDRKAPRRPSSELALGLSSGFIVATFALTKQTFLLPSALLVALAATTFRRDRRWWFGGAAGLAVPLVAMTAYLRGDLLSIARDFAFVARARGATLATSEALPFWYHLSRRVLNVDAAKVAEVLRLESSTLAALALCAVVSAWPLDGLRASPARADARRRLLASAALTAAGYAVVLSSWHWAYLPVVGLVGVALAQPTARDPAAPRRDGDDLRAFVAQGLAALVCARIIARSVLALLLAWTASGLTPDPASIIRARGLVDMPVIRVAGCEPGAYGARVTDGLRLLREAPDQQGSILVTDYVNPFSFALRRRSPRGDAVSWHYYASFSDRAHLPAEQVFRDVSIVMVPMCPLDSSAAVAMTALYSATLEREFERQSSSRYWVLLHRRRPRSLGR